MKAAAFKRQNEMGLIDAPIPKAGAGEVVLKVHNCGICGSNLHACQYGFGMPPDSIMGHEFCGEICELGSGVRNYTIGQRVAVLPFAMCGECERCKRGIDSLCQLERPGSRPVAGRLCRVRRLRGDQSVSAAG